jgi:PAS domain S-box-containing protein
LSANNVESFQGALRNGLEELQNANGELQRAETELDDLRNADTRDSTVDPSQLAYLTADRHGLITGASSCAAELLGLAQERLVGKPLATFVSHTDRRAFRRLLLRLAEAGAYGLELVLVPRSGVPFDAELTVAAGQVGMADDMLLVTVRDIRERKAAEVELRALTEELEQRVAERAAQVEHERRLLAAIVDQIPIPLVVVEAPSGRLTLANEAARCMMLGPMPLQQSFEELSPDRAFHPNGEPFEPTEFPITRAARHGETVRGVLMEIPRGNGMHVLVEVDASPLYDEEGNVTAAVAVYQDVGERERLEHAERDFIANAAHELQTPVTAITSAVEALQSGAKADPEERERFMSHLQREARRLGRLSSALLVLAGAERSREPARLELLPLLPLLQEAADSVPPVEGVEVLVDCGEDVGILTHRDLFLQVLSNLGTNAARNTKSGQIIFAARLTGNMRVVVDVTDTGSGIAPEHQEHVFRRFYRTDSDSAGSGLGLAIASQAMQALGGRLELASVPGKGTTLTMSLPGARLIS